MKVAKEGLRFILGATALAVLWAILGVGVLAGFFLLLAATFAFFFRDPDRLPPPGDGRLVSPADGEVLGL